jgi:hypothetical protein
MTYDEIISNAEIQIISELAKLDNVRNEEREAFRMGFYAGARYGLDAARQEMRSAAKQH